MSNPSFYTESISCEVYDALEQLYRSLNIGLNRHNTLGYTCGQGKMLRLLSVQGKVSQSQLAALLGITASSVSEIADKLLSSGFVVRENDASDKRKSLLVITDSGIAEVERLKDEFVAFINSSFSALNTDELTNLLALLKKVSDPCSVETKHDVIVQAPSIRRGTRL